jgi:hypothetical protein
VRRGEEVFGRAWLLLLASLLISSICGVWNDSMLKNSGASMHTINILLNAFGFVMNGATYIYCADPSKRFVISPRSYIYNRQAIFLDFVHKIKNKKSPFSASPSPRKPREHTLPSVTWKRKRNKNSHVY